jgi:hypothetical protein
VASLDRSSRPDGADAVLTIGPSKRHLNDVVQHAQVTIAVDGNTTPDRWVDDDMQGHEFVLFGYERSRGMT